MTNLDYLLNDPNPPDSGYEPQCEGCGSLRVNEAERHPALGVVTLVCNDCGVRWDEDLGPAPNPRTGSVGERALALEDAEYLPKAERLVWGDPERAPLKVAGLLGAYERLALADTDRRQRLVSLRTAVGLAAETFDQVAHDLSDPVGISVARMAAKQLRELLRKDKPDGA